MLYFCFAADFNYESVETEISRVNDAIQSSKGEVIEVDIEKGMEDSTIADIKYRIQRYAEKFGVEVKLNIQ